MNDAGQGPLPIPPQPVSRHVAVTGSSGLFGSALHARLTAAGQHVTRIVRSRPGEGDVLWEPTAPSFDSAKLASTRVAPRRLLQTGYAFQHPTLEEALQHCLT